MRACEGAMFPNAGAQNGKMCSGGGGSGSVVVFSFVLLCSCVLCLIFEVVRCYTQLFVVCVCCNAHGCLICLCFCWYAHGFFDVFAPLARFSCYAPQLIK